MSKYQVTHLNTVQLKSVVYVLILCNLILLTTSTKNASEYEYTYFLVHVIAAIFFLETSVCMIVMLDQKCLLFSQFFCLLLTLTACARAKIIAAMMASNIRSLVKLWAGELLSKITSEIWMGSRGR